MRDFAKSLLRLPLAVSLLGVEQVDRAFRSKDSSQTLREAGEAMDRVSQVAEEQLQTFREACKTGQQVQKTVVDTWFSLLDCEGCNERMQWLSKKFRDRMG